MDSVQPDNAGTTEADIVIRNILAAQREKKKKVEESGEVASHYAQPQKPKLKLSARSTHISSKLRGVISNASLRLRNSVRRSNRKGSKWNIPRSPSPSSRRKKKRGGLRLKESVKKPPIDMNSLFEAPQPLSAYMMENQKKRQLHRQKHIATAISSISLLFLALGTLIGTLGWLKVNLLHWEYTALLAAMNESSTPWIEDCPNRQLMRTIHGINYTVPCTGAISVDKAKWSSWTNCDGGIQYRWKILKANVSYDVQHDKQIFQEQRCVPVTTSTTAVASTNSTSTTTTTVGP